MAKASGYLLTTKDNPYNPHTHFEEWRVWDERAGYYTLSLLGRIANTSFELSEADQEVAFDAAVDEIVKMNVSGMHVKVLHPDS